MPKFNDIDLKNWKDSDVLTDSLWVINSRDNSGKHSGFYHGNFIPQIPRQLIKRYTKKDDVVFDPFVGSGTTIYETENLQRNAIGVDIQEKLVNKIKRKVDKDNKYFYELIASDSSNNKIVDNIKGILKKHSKKAIQLAILHPPYSDIIKFSDNKEDLSNAPTLNDFRKQFTNVLKNTYEVLENNRYMTIVIGDKYENGEWIPLGFYCMEDAKKVGFKLKSIVVKNMSGNRAKQNKEGIWRYRALSSDYYIFKKEIK